MDDVAGVSTPWRRDRSRHSVWATFHRQVRQQLDRLPGLAGTTSADATSLIMTNNPTATTISVQTAAMPAEQHVRAAVVPACCEAARARARPESSDGLHATLTSEARWPYRVSQGVTFDSSCCSRDSVGEHRRPRLNKNGLAIVPPGSIEQLEPG